MLRTSRCETFVKTLHNVLIRRILLAQGSNLKGFVAFSYRLDVEKRIIIYIYIV